MDPALSIPVARSSPMFVSKLDRTVSMPEGASDGVALHASDPSVFTGLCTALQACGVRASSQGSVNLARSFPAWSQVCCIVAELDFAPTSGASFIRTIRQSHSCLPVIFVAEKPPVAGVVDAMKAGAFDFFEKPFDPGKLAARIEEAILFYRRMLPILAEVARVERLLQALTRRERQMFDLVLDGKSTKEIAFELGIRDVTVDFHRRNVYRKMEVNNAVNLAIIVENYRHERQKSSVVI